jgi:hypothetical protein
MHGELGEDMPVIGDMLPNRGELAIVDVGDMFENDGEFGAVLISENVPDHGHVFTKFTMHGSCFA